MRMRSRIRMRSSIRMRSRLVVVTHLPAGHLQCDKYAKYTKKKRKNGDELGDCLCIDAVKLDF